MKPYADVVHECENWEYGIKLPRREHLFNGETVKGSQFAKPYIEFAVPVRDAVKLRISSWRHIFGDRMIIANATGCSSIWGASAPSMPYCKDEKVVVRHGQIRSLRTMPNTVTECFWPLSR